MAEGYTLLASPLPAGAPSLLVVPGGDLESAWNDEPLLAWLRGTSPTRLGAICHGVVLLGRAGLLKGRRVTHTSVRRYAPSPECDDLLATVGPALSGSTYVDEDVVADGDLVTAKPWAALAFAKVLAEPTLGRDEAARRARYHAGCRDFPAEDPHGRWVIHLSPVPGRAASREDVRAHVVYLRALECTGRLSMAGPFADGSGGMLVVRAATRDEASAILQADPFVQRGVRVAALRQWNLSNADNDHMGG